MHLNTIDLANRHLAAGSDSRVAIVHRAIEGAESQAAVHVFTRVYSDRSIAAARLADEAQASGAKLHPLAGLPVSVKDLFDVEGETTLAGSTVCSGEPPATMDAVVIARLRSAGAAIVGKTNMTEFAFSGVGINPHYGTPRNPADVLVDRIPGGSSSGAAVSVALGLAVAAVGSDTGGSIRIPAALCGLVGFKSTQIRVPRKGAMELSRTLDSVCAMTRCVKDCLTVDAILAGQPLSVSERTLDGVRLAIPQTLMLDSLEPLVAQSFERACRLLSQSGAKLVDLPMAEVAEIAKICVPASFSAIEAFAVHRVRLQQQRSGFDPRVAARIETGTNISAADYLAMLDQRRDWIQRVEGTLHGFDALLCPTVPMVAPAIAPLIASDEIFFKTNAMLLRNPHVINFLDGCSFSLPCHAPGELPMGLMLSSTSGDDARLASVACAVETALNRL